MLRILLVMAVTTTAEGANSFRCEARTQTPYEGYGDWLSVEANCYKEGSGVINYDFERVRMRVRLGRRIGGPNDAFTLHVVHLDRKEGDENLGYWAQISYWQLNQGGQPLGWLFQERKDLTPVFKRLIDGQYHSHRVGSYSSSLETALAYGDTLYHYLPAWVSDLPANCRPELNIGDPREICTEDAPCQLTFRYWLYHKDTFVSIPQMIEMASGNTMALSRLRDELEREQARQAGLRDSVSSLQTELSEVKRNRDGLQEQLNMKEGCDENTIRGDFNGDGRVNFSDFLIFVGLYDANN